MRRWLETQGYVLCFMLARLRVDYGPPFGWLENIWTGIWYRYYCPYPINSLNGRWLARDCFKAGQCGCDNQRRYAPMSPANQTPIENKGSSQSS